MIHCDHSTAVRRVGQRCVLMPRSALLGNCRTDLVEERLFSGDRFFAYCPTKQRAFLLAQEHYVSRKLLTKRDGNLRRQINLHQLKLKMNGYPFSRACLRGPTGYPRLLLNDFALQTGLALVNLLRSVAILHPCLDESSLEY